MIPTIFGPGTGRTYEDLKRQQQLANALAYRRSGSAPRDVGEGLNAIGQALLYRSMTKKSSDLAAQLQGDMQGQWADIFQNNAPAAQPTAGNFNSQADTMGLDTGSSQPPGYAGQGVTIGDRTYDMGAPVSPDYASAIATVESGGRYDAIGPVTKKGNRAYGKYQVMDFNIGPWTEKHLGKRMTPQEFLNNPAAQDTVFNAEFGSYVEKHGNPQDAASMWFSGRPMSEAGNASDGWTTVPEYVAKFTEALGPQPTVSTKGSTDLGMIGGVKPDGSALQSLTGQGRAHASNPNYEDYSQLFREYRFDPPSNDWMPVGQRQGRTVYAAPDYARDALGNYINVSAAEAEQMAQARGSLIPTREEYATLFQNGTRVPMPTGDPATKTAAQYTQGTQSLIDQMGIDPNATLVHGKEFFTGEPTQVASTDPQAQMLAATLTGQSSQPQMPGNDQMAFNMPETQLTSPLQMPATTPQPVQPQMVQQPQVSTQNQNNLQSEFQRVQQQASQVQQMMLQPGWKEMASPAMKAQATQVLEQYKMLSQQMARQSDPRYQMQLQRDALEIQRLQRELSAQPERQMRQDRNGVLRYTDTGEEVYPNVQAANQPPEITDVNGQDAIWDEQQQTFVPAPTSGFGDPPADDMSESQRRVYMFNSMQRVNGPAIDMIEENGFDPSNIQDKLADGVLGGNFFKSAEGQMYNAAAGAWAEGALRLATGAAATPQEYDRIVGQYFARVGDRPETIAFKRKMREAYQNVLTATLQGDINADIPTPLLFAVEQFYANRTAAPVQPAQAPNLQETPTDELRRMLTPDMDRRGRSPQ